MSEIRPYLVIGTYESGRTDTLEIMDRNDC